MGWIDLIPITHHHETLPITPSPYFLLFTSEGPDCKQTPLSRWHTPLLILDSAELPSDLSDTKDPACLYFLLI